jgi:hypothetical protein
MYPKHERDAENAPTNIFENQVEGNCSTTSVVAIVWKEVLGIETPALTVYF